MVELVDTESLVPQEHLLQEVDAAVDHEKLYEIVEPLYSGNKLKSHAMLPVFGRLFNDLTPP